MRLWIVGLLGPGLVVSELLQGRVSLGIGLGFICILIWTKLAARLGFSGRTWERVGNVSLVIGGLLLGWHYLRWWIEFLR